MKALRIGLVWCLCILVAACGGGGGGGGGGTAAVATASATGIWDGTVTENGVGTINVLGLISGSQLRFISLNGDVLYEGTITVTGSNFTATTTSIVTGGGPFATSTLTGTVVTGSNITGTFTSSNGSSGSFSLVYSPFTARGASLPTISANWSVTDGAYTFTVSIDANGVITGSDTDGCVYNGNVTITDPMVNIYTLNLAATTCGSFTGSYSGYGVVSDTVTTNDTLTFVVSNANYIIFGELSR